MHSESSGARRKSDSDSPGQAHRLKTPIPIIGDAQHAVENLSAQLKGHLEQPGDVPARGTRHPDVHTRMTGIPGNFSDLKLIDIRFEITEKTSEQISEALTMHLHIVLSPFIREHAVEPPGTTQWLIRHAVPGGYIRWWLFKLHGENSLSTFYKHYAYAGMYLYRHKH
ncbi:hypothetical protein B0H19DRAFT_1073552 [Mycena capillaripes]|nr:hypothetical protein B0H19DRAFT_1073552 [Mycena capillaripes]